MPEHALAVPLTGDEIIEILVNETRRRLQSLGPLQGGKEYAGATVSFEHKITLFRMATNGGGDKSTLAWGKTEAGYTGTAALPVETLADSATYTTDPDVNAEREKHDLPMTVEAGDGKGGKVRKKVKVKGA